jgi:two-component system CheB/CheR fusion protein
MVTFPIVGVGASAGGLDAFRRLLSCLDANLGMAYVFIQHLDPTHPSLMPSLLSRMTVLPIREVQDGMRLQPDTIYIAPRGVEVELVESRFSTRPLSLSAPKAGLRTAIDHFFTSLAETHESGVIGILLSGTGSDGVAGLRAIKAKGGITFAQDEFSATFPQMPHNAEASGCVDSVLPPEAIAETLGKLSGNSRFMHALAETPGTETPGAETSFTKPASRNFRISSIGEKIAPT